MDKFSDRKLARTTGIVTLRQRPGTASGVMFLWLEDETGSKQVVIFPDHLDKQKMESLNATLLTVYGQWQMVGENKNVIAQSGGHHTELLGALSTIRAGISNKPHMLPA